MCEANKQMVLYTHEIGMGYTSFQTLCAVFGMPGMPVMNKKTYHRLDKQINDSIRRTCQVTLDENVEKVKDVYHQMFPLGIPSMNPALPQVNDEEEEADDTEWDEDGGTPWMDVSFDGTWMKRGFTSHYGIGTVIDIFTGYVIDFELLCTYCHV